jgi:hypothetical protein
MNKFTIVILFIFGSLAFESCISQQETLRLKNDKKFSVSYRRFVNSLHINPPKFDSVNVELRFWKLDWSSGNHTVFLFRRLIDGKWTCERIPFYFYNDSHYDFPAGRFQCSLKQWNQRWIHITQAGYLNLQTQTDLHLRITPKGMEVPLISDGVTYTIDVLTPKKKRSFTYSNPEDFDKFFKQKGFEIKEYNNFNSLLSILKEELNF